MAELERLGDSDEWADCLLFVLDRSGWTVTVRPGLGGGRLVIARQDGVEVRHQADTLAGAARPVLERAARYRRLTLLPGGA